MRNVARLLLCAVLLNCSLLAQNQHYQPSLTTCELQQHSADYDGKLVTVRATVVAGFEIFAIRSQGTKCSLWLEYPGGGPTASMSIDALTPSISRPQVVLREDRAFKHFQKLLEAQMYSRDRGAICMACSRYEVSATMTGRVDTAGTGRGFGHMNMFPARFVLQQVREVSAKDLAAIYDQTKFSATPVHLPTAYFVGKVFSPEGKPVENIDVTALSTEDVPAYLEDFTESTDKKGRFKIGVPPGTYVVGINVSSPPSRAFPYETFYSPGTADKTKARHVQVKDGQRLNLTIKVREALSPRKIPVKVVWPDGTAVKDANVWLAEQKDPISIVGGSVSHTNTEGFFELVGFRGIAYFLHTNIYVKPRYTPFCADKRTITETETPTEPIVLTLNVTGDVCKSRD